MSGAEVVGERAERVSERVRRGAKHFQRVWDKASGGGEVQGCGCSTPGGCGAEGAVILRGDNSIGQNRFPGPLLSPSLLHMYINAGASPSTALQNDSKLGGIS